MSFAQNRVVAEGAKLCEFCGEPLEGKRADARFHDECKDRNRRERDRPADLRDRLSREMADLEEEGERIEARLDELQQRGWENLRARKGILAAMRHIDGSAERPGRLKRAWRWLNGDEPVLIDIEMHNGRTDAEKGS